MKNAKSKAINFGLIGGIISIILSLISYFMGTQLVTNFWMGIIFGLASLGVVITLLAMSPNAFKKANGGFATFQEAFRESFITAVTISVIGLIFGFIFFTVIDPGYGDEMNELIKETTVERMEKWGAEDAQIEKQIAKMEKNDRFSIPGMLKSTMFGLIFYGVISLIIAAIVKKKKPELIEEV